MDAPATAPDLKRLPSIGQGCLTVLPVAVLSIALMTLGSVTWPRQGKPPEDTPGVAPIEAMIRWDAGWYGDIVDHGYRYTPGQQSPVAFFPLYPMTIRALAGVGLNKWVAATLVSLVCGLLALSLFLRWVLLRAPEHAATAFWLLALYPFAEYLYGVVYSDAMFLVLVVGAFLALETKQPWWAAVLGALATACRPVAPAVVIGLLARSIELRVKSGQKIRVVDLLPALSGIGLAAYMIFLEVNFDDALAFAHVQSAPGWDQAPGWDTWLKVTWFKTMFPQVSPAVAVRLGGHALVTVLALIGAGLTFKRLGWGYGTYTALVVGIPAISSKDFQGLGRYVIAAFPLFLTLAMLLASKPRLRPWVFIGFALTFAALAYALGAGGYVA